MPAASSPLRESSSSADGRIEEEATLWFARLCGDRVTAAQRTAFAAWLEADERHRREYEALMQIWNQSAQLTPSVRSKGKGRIAATVAGVALLCAWIGFAWFDGRIATDAGERQHLRLTDGSELDIAPHTRLRVKFDGSRRQLELDEGQLVVSVARDARRPFVVVAGGGVIQDIGTRFEVRTDPRRTRVVVAEGAVEVSLPAAGESRRLRAGEAVDFDAAALSPPRPVDALASLAWTKGQLSFDAASLAEVVSALNRYRQTPIALNDPALARVRISGVFLLDDEAATLRALQQVAPVQFLPEAGQIIAKPAKR